MSLSRLFSVLLLGWFLTVSVGVPLRFGRQKTASDERYPCELCGCGCSSADQCWRQCCCFSLAERLAWAEREGVEPPVFVRQAVAQADKRSTMQVAATYAPADEDNATCSGSCCQREPHGLELATQLTSSRRKVLARSGSIQSLACRGGTMQWVAVSPVTITATTTYLKPAAGGERTCLRGDTSESVELPPPTPPPEPRASGNLTLTVRPV